ncbi:MAG: cell division protein FtsX [SAR86 cluster bacterium]|uniref:Cell division protein FtsX n=1 Tax=SAR86 cluster bacterium TaxID=2030880 RepID=A0A2A5AH26_9GAMM|nr:MAG: cell division protein FtsX [SAR86 cluster bacterium]
MEIGPILRAMLRNKLGVVLVALQIAFTMTVIINAVFIINERSRLMARPSGLDEANLFYLSSIGFGDGFNEEISISDDLALLRQTPGIVNATVTNAIPVSGSGSGTAVRTTDDESQPQSFAAIYRVDEQAIDTMGLELIAGENFTASDILIRERNSATAASKTVISLAFAKVLYPDEEPGEILGRTIYQGANRPQQIVGVVSQLQAPWMGNSNVEQSMMVPENVSDGASIYLIRTEPGERDRLMVAAEELLVASNSNRIIRGLESLEQTRIDAYRIDSAMSNILWVLIITLVFITCAGIVGLAVFGINRRRKQIGTRRALGATQFQILRHFMIENFFITGIGVTLGAVLTIAFSILLTTNFNMPTMAWYYTPLGMIALILVGQISVLGPSAGAARIEPAIATRSI